jgi:hypothetical protein
MSVPAPSPGAQSPLALATMNMYADPQQLLAGPTTLSSRRVHNAVGSIVRTLIIAGLVGGLGFGARYGWEWNQDREAAAVPRVVPLLPVEPVPPVDARYVTYRFAHDQGQSQVGQLNESGFTVSIDLTTNAFHVTSTVENATIQSARTSDGADWLRDGLGVYQPVVYPDQAAVSELSDVLVDIPSLVTISDLLPVETHPFLTVVSDDVISVNGTAFGGPDVIGLEASVDPDTPDDAFDALESPPASLVISTAGQVQVRHLSVTLDHIAFARAHPGVASRLNVLMPVDADGMAIQATSVAYDMWIDRTGMIRRLSVPSGFTQFEGGYELVSIATTGPGPLDAVQFGTVPLPEGQP